MARRIVVEEPCEHGQFSLHVEAPEPGAFYRNYWSCPGGSRRVLDPGSFALIEKVDGEWQVPIRLGLYDRDGGPVDVDLMFDTLADALAGGEQP